MSDAGVRANETFVVTFDSLAPEYGTLSGDAAIYPASVSGQAAAPAGDTTPFAAVPKVAPDGPTSYTATLDFGTQFANAKNLSLYWGSVDLYNSLDVLDTGGNILLTITGAQLSPANGDQGVARRVYVDGLAGTSFGALRFNSTATDGGPRAFEFDTIGLAVPEPATWAMMIVGFGGIGMTMRSVKRRKTDMLTA